MTTRSLRCPKCDKLPMSCECEAPGSGKAERRAPKLNTNRSTAPAQASGQAKGTRSTPDAEIAVAEAPGWLERNGYRVISRQAIHKAIEVGRLTPSSSVTVAGKTWRWVRAEDLAKLAGPASESEADSGSG